MKKEVKDEVFNSYLTLGDKGNSWLSGGLFIASNLRLNLCIRDSSSDVWNRSRVAGPGGLITRRLLWSALGGVLY